MYRPQIEYQQLGLLVSSDSKGKGLTGSCEDDATATLFLSYSWTGFEHRGRSMLDGEETPGVEVSGNS